LKKEGISGKQKDRVIYKDVLIIATTKYVCNKKGSVVIRIETKK
jgi:hypothetical protein